MMNAHTSQHRRQYPAQQQQHPHQHPQHQMRAQQQVQHPQHQQHMQQHPHHPSGYAPRSQQHPPSSHQQQQYHAPPQQQHHRAHSTNQHAMTGPDPDGRAFAPAAPAPQLMAQPRQNAAAPTLMQQPQRAPPPEAGEVYYDEIPDLQNPNPWLYTQPAPGRTQAPTVISGVKPFQPRAPQQQQQQQRSAASSSASAERPSLEGLQQQQLVSGLARSRAPSSSDLASDPPAPAPAAPQVPRVLRTASSSSSASGGGGAGGGGVQPRVIQTTQPNSARQHHHHHQHHQQQQQQHASASASSSAAAAQPPPQLQAEPLQRTKTASMAPPTYSEVPSTVLCVLGEMDAVSPLVRELQITVLKQELSLGKAARELDRRRRRESWPPRLDMDKIRALERSMIPSASNNAPSSPAVKLGGAAIPSPRAQQDEALGVDPDLPIKGRLAQLREKWEGKGGSIPLPTLTSSMPKVQPKWNRHAPVHFTSQPAPMSRQEEEEEESSSAGASLTIQGLSLAVSAHQPSTPSTPQKHAPLPAPVLPEPEPVDDIPKEQFSFRLPGESAPDTAADRPGGGLNTVEPLFKARESPFAALLAAPAREEAPREEAPRKATPPLSAHPAQFSIPDLQLDGLDGEESSSAGMGLGGLMESAPEGANGSTRDNSLDAPLPSSPPPPAVGSGYAAGPTDNSPPGALGAGYAVADGGGGGGGYEEGPAHAGSAEPQFGALPVEDEEGEEGAKEEEHAHDESVVVDLAAALMTGPMARLNKKIKDFEDGFWVLSCKGSEGHAAGVNIGFAYKLECFASKRAAASNEEPEDSMFLQGATVKFVQGTVFKVQTTNELNKKGTTNMMSTNSEKEAAEWMGAMELVPDVTVDWVGKDGTELAH